MVSDLAEMFAEIGHTVQVQTRTGGSAYSNVYGPAVTVAGFMEEKRRIIPNSTGTMVESSATFYGPPEAYPLFTTGSKVTFTADGSVSEVLSVSRFDSGGLGLPDHCAVTLL